MSPNESHFPATHDNGETAHCKRFYYCSRVYMEAADVGFSEAGQYLELLDPNLSKLSRLVLKDNSVIAFRWPHRLR